MIKRRIKAFLGWLAFHSGLHRRLIGDRAIVALFHRVDDRYGGNPISCTTREFRGFLRFFGKFFTVITLQELLDRIASGKSVAGCLVITFDDGYLDNHRDAAPELRRQGLPACFFIATDFIGSQRVPWWDEELGIRSEWMSWDQVRALKSQGFEIGAHTMNHVDLGVVKGDEAEKEIVGSGERLHRELDAPVPFFTYPYGRPHQITEENRELVRRAGFSCCLSAFGGTVTRRDDAFRLKRTPVSPWHISPYQFGFETMVSKS
ncbi:MAG TPA: polysaccharide deacetylase family protein [Gemmatimonadales bacterium]|jgi:peptidoglycan/xylan/chitin deacetylase (PgdA/CDA1 family)